MNNENKKKYLFINGKIKILIYDLEKNEFINDFERKNEILSILNYKNKLLIYYKNGEIFSFDISENKEKIDNNSSYYSSDYSGRVEESEIDIKKTICLFCDLEFGYNFNEHLFEKHKEEIIKKYNKNIIKNDNEENNKTSNDLNHLNEHKHGKIRIPSEKIKNVIFSEKNEINNSSSSDNLKFTKIIIIKTKCLFCNSEIEGNFEEHLFKTHKEEIIKNIMQLINKKLNNNHFISKKI
jgi:hypothetical protein